MTTLSIHSLGLATILCLAGAQCNRNSIPSQKSGKENNDSSGHSISKSVPLMVTTIALKVKNSSTSKQQLPKNLLLKIAFDQQASLTQSVLVDAPAFINAAFTTYQNVGSLPHNPCSPDTSSTNIYIAALFGDANSNQNRQILTSEILNECRDNETLYIDLDVLFNEDDQLVLRSKSSYSTTTTQKPSVPAK